MQPSPIERIKAPRLPLQPRMSVKPITRQDLEKSANDRLGPLAGSGMTEAFVRTPDSLTKVWVSMPHRRPGIESPLSGITRSVPNHLAAGFIDQVAITFNFRGGAKSDPGATVKLMTGDGEDSALEWMTQTEYVSEIDAAIEKINARWNAAALRAAEATSSQTAAALYPVYSTTNAPETVSASRTRRSLGVRASDPSSGSVSFYTGEPDAPDPDDTRRHRRSSSSSEGCHSSRKGKQRESSLSEAFTER